MITGLPSEKSDPVFSVLRAAVRPPPNPATPQREYSFCLSIESAKGRFRSRPVNVIAGESTTTHVSGRDAVAGSQAVEMIRGRVVDRRSGRPITKFQLVRRYRPGMLSVEDANGEFVLTGFTVGAKFRIYIYADGFAPCQQQLTAGPVDQVRQAEFAPEPAGGLRGVVRDADGNPVRGAEIVAGVPGSHSSGEFRWDDFENYVDGRNGWQMVQRMTTGADGCFRFCEGSRPNTLAVIASGCARRMISSGQRSQPDADGRIVVTLHPESRIRGVVLQDGRPLAGARLSLGRAGHWSLTPGERRADQDGRFDFPCLQPGEYFLGVLQYSGRTGIHRLTRKIELLPGQSVEVELAESDGNLSISGRAMPFALVSVRAPAGHMFTAVGTIADVDGYYQLKHLRPGEYTITQRSASPYNRWPRSNRGSIIQLKQNRKYDFTSPWPNAKR